MFNEYQLQQLEKDLKIVYRGVVTNVFPDSYTCTVKTGHGVKYENLPIGVSGAYGNSFNAYIPEIGTPVLICKVGGNVEILRFMSPKGRGEPNYPVSAYSRVNSNSEKSQNTSDRALYQAGKTIGVLQGDFVVGNSEGAFLSVMRGGMVKIGSGPSASLYTFTTDDLVRLVSRNYQHFHDGGMTQITNDMGEVTTERYHSVMYFETLGEESEGSGIDTDDNSDKTFRKKRDLAERMARSRMHEFTGWLGDVFHLFVTKRPSTNKRTDPDTPEGVAEIFIGQDGAIRVRSAREITLEKVAKVRVPKKIREPWMEKEGDSPDSGYEKTPHEIYEWKDGKGRSLQELEHRTQQVDHEELRHFKDHKKDWNVKSEKDAPLPNPADDIYEGSAEEEFYETTSHLTLRNDGSVYVEDSWGSTLELTHEDAILSARRDIKFIAGRDFTVLSGRDATIRGTEYVDIVAHKEDLRLKGNKKALLFADSGVASIDSGPGGKTIVNARDGKLLLRAEKADLSLHADQGSIKALTPSSSIKLRAKSDIQVLADEGKISAFAGSKIGMQSPGEVFAAVGPRGSEPKMEATSRNCGSKTNTPRLTDSGNTADVDPKVYIKLDSSIYHMDCPGEPKICKLEGKYCLNDRDTDDKEVPEQCCDEDCCTIMHSNKYVPSRNQKGDHIWTIPGNPSPPSDTVEGPVADENKNDFAEGRFHWRENPRDDTYLYEPVWAHQGDEDKSIEYSTQKWNGEKYSPSSQEVPDAGKPRPIVGDEQECGDEGQSTEVGACKEEQVHPFSKYKKYTDGTISWEDGVEPGEFSDECDMRMPNGDYSRADEDYPTGRFAKYPGGSGETNPSPTPLKDDDVVEKPIDSNDIS